jgi:hypothetical protein
VGGKRIDQNPEIDRTRRLAELLVSGCHWMWPPIS